MYDNVFPIKRIEIKQKDSLSPWITKGIKKSSEKQQRLYEKFLKHKTEANLNKYKDYKKLGN